MKRLSVLMFPIAFLFTSCTYHHIDNNTYDFVISSVSQGKTIEEAKNKAFSILSEQISVEVISKFDSKEKLHNNIYSHEYNSNIDIKSSSYFQGVSIYRTIKIDHDLYEVSLGLNKEAIINTIKYLTLQLDPDSIDSYSRNDLASQISMARFLFSLMKYADSNNINYPAISYDLESYIKQLSKIVTLGSSVYFSVYPDNNNTLVTIDNKGYQINNKIHLKAGKYSYNIALNGYLPKIGEIILLKNEDRKIEVFLQKKQQKNIAINLIINNNSKLETQNIINLFSNLLQNNQMILDQESKNILSVNISNNISSKILDNYYNNVISVNISSNIEGNKKSISFFASYLSKNIEFPDNVLIHEVNQQSQDFFAFLYD